MRALLEKCSNLDGSFWRRFHLIMTAVWMAAIIPTVIWWHDSVLWVALMSAYALGIGHFSAWQAARAETVQQLTEE
jgi:hypothetical protein